MPTQHHVYIVECLLDIDPPHIIAGIVDIIGFVQRVILLATLFTPLPVDLLD